MDKVDRLIDERIQREGAYVDHPSDSGGPTMWGITERVARAHGYEGPMTRLPRSLAASILKTDYYYRPKFHLVHSLAPRVAEEMFHTEVNASRRIATRWLQRLLNAHNRRGRDYADVAVDGLIGPQTLGALGKFLMRRAPHGPSLLVAGLNGLQLAYYLELVERREKDEDFFTGWVRWNVLEDLRGL